MHRKLTRLQDTTRRWSFQLGRDPLASMVQEIPQLFCWLAHSHRLAIARSKRLLLISYTYTRSPGTESSGIRF